MSRSDKQTATDLTCEKTSSGVMYNTSAGRAQYRVGKVAILHSTKATVDMFTLGGSVRGVPLPLSLRDTWCVAV